MPPANGRPARHSDNVTTGTYRYSSSMRVPRHWTTWPNRCDLTVFGELANNNHLVLFLTTDERVENSMVESRCYVYSFSFWFKMSLKCVPCRFLIKNDLISLWIDFYDDISAQHWKFRWKICFSSYKNSYTNVQCWDSFKRTYMLPSCNIIL